MRLVLLVLLLVLMKGSPGGKAVRTKANGTDSRVLRSHIDVRSKADVTRHIKGKQQRA
jgi:hypothetical protein